MKLLIVRTLRQAAWAPLIVFVFFYAVAAEVFNAYILYPWLDMPTHFCGGLSITYFYLAAAEHAQALTGPIPRSARLMMAMGLTAITAVLWEFAEYASDVLLHTEMNLGVSDTLSDLFFGLLGGAAMIALAAFVRPIVLTLSGEAGKR